jgi:hypothetical protein
MTHDEMIAVIQAHKDGKVIEFRQPGGEWESLEFPMWNFTKYEFRIKTEPVEYWAGEFNGGEYRCQFGDKEKAEAWLASFRSYPTGTARIFKVREVL